MPFGVTNDDVVIKTDGRIIKALVRYEDKLYGQGVEMNAYNEFSTRKMVTQLVYDVNCKNVYGPHKMEIIQCH